MAKSKAQQRIEDHRAAQQAQHIKGEAWHDQQETDNPDYPKEA